MLGASQPPTSCASQLIMDGPMVLAGLKAGGKLLGLGAEMTHEPAENLAVAS